MKGERSKHTGNWKAVMEGTATSQTTKGTLTFILRSVALEDPLRKHKDSPDGKWWAWWTVKSGIVSMSITDYTFKGEELIHVQKHVSTDGRKLDAFFFIFLSYY